MARRRFTDQSFTPQPFDINDMSSPDWMKRAINTSLSSQFGGTPAPQEPPGGMSGTGLNDRSTLNGTGFFARNQDITPKEMQQQVQDQTMRQQYDAMQNQQGQVRPGVSDLSSRIKNMLSTSTQPQEENPLALAGGGPLMPDRMHIVGERGPELIVPNGQGGYHVVPSEQTQQILMQRGMQGIKGHYDGSLIDAPSDNQEKIEGLKTVGDVWRGFVANSGMPIANTGPREFHIQGTLQDQESGQAQAATTPTQTGTDTVSNPSQRNTTRDSLVTQNLNPYGQAEAERPQFQPVQADFSLRPDQNPSEQTQGAKPPHIMEVINGTNRQYARFTPGMAFPQMYSSPEEALAGRSFVQQQLDARNQTLIDKANIDARAKLLEAKARGGGKYQPFNAEMNGTKVPVAFNKDSGQFEYTPEQQTAKDVSEFDMLPDNESRAAYLFNLGPGPRLDRIIASSRLAKKDRDAAWTLLNQKISKSLEKR